MFTYYSFPNIYTYISEYYFQIRYMLIGKYILVIFHSLVIRNFKGTCSSRNAEGVRGQGKFDDTCPKRKTSPIATGELWRA